MVKRALEEISADVHLLLCAAPVCLAALLASHLWHSEKLREVHMVTRYF